MSKSVDRREKALQKQPSRWFEFLRSRRFTSVVGLTCLPIASFALASGNTLLLSTAGTACAAAAFVLARAHRANHDRTQKNAIMDNGAFNHLVEHVKDGVIQLDENGVASYISQSSGKLFGCEKYELAGSGLSDRTHVLDRPLLLKALSDARSDGVEQTIEVRMRRDDYISGRAAPNYIWVDVNLSPIDTAQANNASHSVIMFLRDISVRKDFEKSMLSAQKLAEEASLAKSQFLATIGHELRTPLNAIVGFSDMMTNGIGGTLEPTHAEYAGHISQSGHHLLEVVNMLLDMAKIEAGRFELQTERFEPERLVAPCVKIVSRAAQEKGVHVEVDYGKYIPEMVGDERACRQILINLLSNAIKFSDAGSTVTWGMKRQGQSLRLTVSDTGIGMSDEVVSRLGEPFFQAESSAARKYEGTGLGISIVKGLVELHDGTINVKSRPGQGTIVTVLLPIAGPASKPDSDESPVTQLIPDVTKTQPIQWAEPKRIAQ